MLLPGHARTERVHRAAEPLTCHGAPCTHCGEQQASHGEHGAHIVPVMSPCGAVKWTERSRARSCSDTVMYAGDRYEGGFGLDAAPAFLTLLTPSRESNAP